MQHYATTFLSSVMIPIKLTNCINCKACNFMQTINCKIITFNTHVFFWKTNTNEEHKTRHCIALKDIAALCRVIFAQKNLVKSVNNSLKLTENSAK